LLLLFYMKILVACEESQAVCKAFRAKGHEAYSCDILPCSGGYPEWHIQGDALIEAYSGKYDMMIAHPPCTYLSNAGARFLYPKGILNHDRYEQGLEAKEFFLKLLNAPIEKICVENPIQSTIFEIEKYTQTIEPYYFGHPFKKKTCLWLKNLPELKPTKMLEKPESTKVVGNWFNKGGKERQKNRSKTFQGIADAMAEQWG
jgi:site-specific DNA-cytosine methylase